MTGGWIKLYRQLLEKPIWQESTPEQKVILITLLSMANHEEREWEWQGEPYKASPGQFVTSLDSIRKKCGKGISLQNVRTALKRFEKYEFLTNQPTNKNRLITIVNWEVYQSKDNDLTKELTSNQQATNKQLTTNKNEKNYKNEKNNKTSSSQPRKKRVYDTDSVYYILAEELFKQICQNQEIKKPNLQSWADDIRKMIEIDKRTENQVRGMIEWSQHNVFWASNILSAKKLREKYDTMAAQANRDYKTKQTKTLEYEKFSTDELPI
ncbi:replication protein [Enterococcus faecium]|uniref:replication protein n=3 Tax=Enterococcus faecium TaxID=1352 RepID=UPI000F770566|nr:replication protein [Enterococcus faecium]MBW4137273.1 replication protein [Enterococcus faecium]MBY3608166.1 replication protein [Enterococcus faecium]MBY3654390.1 replication protein [Enterococcus faecium]MCH3677626.1 replication protein [Enterococcus faecium]MCX3933817.1 replication protein [Enterococcus faecium]